MPTSDEEFLAQVQPIAGYLVGTLTVLVYVMLFATLFGISGVYSKFRLAKVKRKNGIAVRYKIAFCSTTIRPFVLLLVMALAFTSVEGTIAILRRLLIFNDPKYQFFCPILSRLGVFCYGAAKFLFFQFLFFKAKTFYDGPTLDSSNRYSIAINCSAVTCAVMIFISGLTETPVIEPVKFFCLSEQLQLWVIVWSSFDWITSVLLAIFFFRPLLEVWRNTHQEAFRQKLSKTLRENMVLGVIMTFMSPLFQSIFAYYSGTTNQALIEIFGTIAGGLDLFVNCTLLFIGSRGIWEWGSSDEMEDGKQLPYISSPKQTQEDIQHIESSVSKLVIRSNPQSLESSAVSDKLTRMFPDSSTSTLETPLIPLEEQLALIQEHDSHS
jgi:hypothetical protein